MRVANVAGRATILVTEQTGIDVHKASSGRFGPAMNSIYERWDHFTNWAAEAGSTEADVVIERSALGSPSPEPRQVLAVGLNYSDHAKESGFEQPDRLPPVFTKFVTSISGPDTTVTLPPGGNTDWEVELVAIIGKRASSVAAADAWSYIAGLAAGQDLSERVAQLSGPAPQFGLGKSFHGFAPMGPWLVTPDEFEDPNDLEIGCKIGDEVMQSGRTGDLIFSIPELVEGLSKVVTLLPGDVIFTGTPAGVGLGRKPQRYLQPGDQLVTWVKGIGELHQRFVSHATAR